MTKETVRQLIDHFGLGAITLQELLGEVSISPSIIPTTRTPAWPHDILQVAEYCYDAWRTRERHFAGHQLFVDPAWDILLDIFIRQARGELVSVKSASVGSVAPASTALRWLNQLEAEGIIASQEDA